MRRWQAGAAALALTALTAASTGIAGAGSDSGRALGRPFTFAVIGDVPYSAPQQAGFVADIAELNAAPDVELVAHLGDIKSGSSPCTDAYFAQIRSAFDRFADPLVYTPGDNEWTDCHRSGADPLERLAGLRSVFFPAAGQTLGSQPMAVESQAADGYVENVSFVRSGVAFAAVHLVGSNNSMANWTGRSAPTPEQAAEVLGRTSAGIELLRDTFDGARARKDRAVVLLTQADMFDPTYSPTFAQTYAFKPVVQALIDEASAFDGAVFLINGDSHVFNQDAPLAPGSEWLTHYGVRGSAENLTRYTVQGADASNEWLRVVADKGSLTFERVPFSG